jgi:RHS repeat-associated protein
MPDPFNFIAYQDLSFDFEGRPVRLSPGQTLPLRDACELLRFINKVRALPSGGVEDLTDEGLDALGAQCQRIGGGPGGASPPPDPPPTPPPNPEPSSTGRDGSPTGGAETAQTLGAPAPGIEGGVSSRPRAAGESDGRPLAEQYFSSEPLADYDVVSQLVSNGVPDAALDGELERVRHNDPPDGEPHPTFGNDDTQTPESAVDPVIVFSGEYALTITDVEIPSRGFPMRLVRSYRSGPVSFGPWGYNWDHNYNVYLRELRDGGAAIWTGALNEDVYLLGPDGELESPLGVFRKLKRYAPGPLDPSGYELSDSEGMRQVFERPVGWPRPDRIPLVRIEDRHGNMQHLAYDTEGRLASLQDHAARKITFAYGSCGLLEQISDHTGRTWQYFHDREVEHLVAVRTPGTLEYPEGLTTIYEYERFRQHPALVHNLVRVTDPAGQVVVENEYGDDPASEDFGRIVRQQFGNYEATFHATVLQYVPRVPEAINVPAIRVDVVDPGILRMYTFNYRGDLLDGRFRLVRDGSYRLVAHTYRYDEQGNLVEQREPNGLGILYTHDATNPDPRARGNPLRVELVAPPAMPSPSRILRTFTYEPQFNRLKTSRDEGGHVTTFVYDYEQAIGNKGDVVRIEYPKATLPGGASQARVEHFEYNTFGQIMRHTTGAGHVHSFAYAPADSSAGYLELATLDVGGAGQTRRFEYDVHGYLAAVIDALGRRVESDVDALGRVVETRLPAVAGVVDRIHFSYTPDGRVRREEVPRGEFDDGVITDPFIVHQYEYDLLGRLVAATLGANTRDPVITRYELDGEGRPSAIVDPLGIRTLLTYDERGLPLTLTEAAGTPREATSRFVYDRSGNRVAFIDPAGRRIDYMLDPWGRLRALTLPGSSSMERTRIELTLNFRDQPERIRIRGITTPGSAGTLFDLQMEFDERGRRWRSRLANREAQALHDADERIVRLTDQRGSAMIFEYDGLDRIVRRIDPLGNAELRKYDAAGNLLRITRHESLPGGGTEVAIGTVQYDERNRPHMFTDALGRLSRVRFDARDLIVEETDPRGIKVSRAWDLLGNLVGMTAPVRPGITARHAWSYDRAGRLTAYADPEGAVTTYAHDERYRRTEFRYPDGRVHRTRYGLNLQPTSDETPGGTVITYGYGADASMNTMTFATGPGVIPTAPITIVRDGLRRPIQLAQGGMVIERTFDSSLRLLTETTNGTTISAAYDDVAGVVQLTYPDGRVDSNELDPLSRLVRIRLSSVGAAGLTGALVAGDELVRYDYRGVERVARRSLHNGVVTDAEFDNAHRLTAIAHRDAAGAVLAKTRYVLDAVDRRRIVWSEPLPQQPTRLDFDDLSRLTHAEMDLALPEPAPTPTQAAADAAIVATLPLVSGRSEDYILDLSDTRTHRTVLGPAGAIDDQYTLTPTYEIARLDRAGAGAGSWLFQFDGEGRCTQDTRHRYAYDALGRLAAIKRLPALTPVLTQSFDVLGRVVSRTDATGTTKLRHFGARLIQEDDAAGNPLKQMSYGIGVDEVFLESTGTTRWALQDAASTLLAYTDDAGTVLERYLYSPFGEATIWAPDGMVQRAASAIGAEPRFAGHTLLPVGLYAARTRVLDPVIGRFLQPDPVLYSDSACPYTYVHHDPVGWVDPTGEVGVLVGLAVAALTGVVFGTGLNLIRQDIQKIEDPNREFSWSELGWSALTGGGMGLLLVFAPEVAIPFAILGVRSGISEIHEGHLALGTFDVATSLLPFLSKSVRTSSFGKGSLFSPARGLGPLDPISVRLGRFSTIGQEFFNPEAEIGRVTHVAPQAKISSIQAQGILKPRTLDLGGRRGVWVSPWKASQMTTWRRMLSGLPESFREPTLSRLSSSLRASIGSPGRAPYVEFDVVPGELVRPTGLKSLFGRYQRQLLGLIDLTGRNPVFGELPLDPPRPGPDALWPWLRTPPWPAPPAPAAADPIVPTAPGTQQKK